MPKILAKYRNGNCHVTLESDGTKTREYDGEPHPKFPESVDLKITDYCDLNCSYCHECSSLKGKHASIETIHKVIQNLPAGVELAIGGGNPLAHPDIINILTMIKNTGLVANMTVNVQHLRPFRKLTRIIRDRGLIRGLGISCILGISYVHGFSDDIMLVADENTVYHVIAGETDMKSFERINHYGDKVLILGYKQYGRGMLHYSETIEKNLSKWRYWIGTVIGQTKTIISFDNLAIKQLGIRDIISIDDWDKCYMGDDGKFTLYIDAVNEKYAVSSINDRVPLNGMTIREAFCVLA